MNELPQIETQTKTKTKTLVKVALVAGGIAALAAFGWGARRAYHYAYAGALKLNYDSNMVETTTLKPGYSSAALYGFKASAVRKPLTVSQVQLVFTGKNMNSQALNKSLRNLSLYHMVNDAGYGLKQKRPVLLGTLSQLKWSRRDNKAYATFNLPASKRFKISPRDGAQSFKLLSEIPDNASLGQFYIKVNRIGRTRIISNQSQSPLLKISASPNQTSNCEENNYKMAFILVEDSNHPATSKDIDKINNLKQKASERFSWATRNLASLDISYPIITIKLENNPSVYDIAKEFYKANPDDFHFLTIYDTYKDNNTQFHISAKNNIKGIGMDLFNNTNNYGSEGKLLGASWMKNINMYKDSTLSVNAILHETSHQWGAFVDFIDEDGQESNSLRNPYNLAHWDKKLEGGYDTLGGFSWTDNKNGTLTAKTITDYKEGYSDLDLYLLGLISKNEVGPVKLIMSDYDTKYIQPGTTISGTIKNISIEQIIKAEGERECILDNKTNLQRARQKERIIHE